MFAEDISEDFSDLTFTGFYRVFLDIFEIFAEDCFLLRSFRKCFTLWVFTLSCFQLKFGLVFFAYRGKSVWSFWHTVPPGWKFGLDFSAYGFPRRTFWKSRAAKRGVSNGGFPDLDFLSLSFLFCPFLSFFCPFLSFFVLFCPFWDFPIFLGFSRFARGWSGIFPIRPFPLSRPIKSTYEEQSRKGPRHNLDLFRKKWETPGFGNPPV